jgi:hypothetical protein
MQQDYARLGLQPGGFSDSIGLWAPVQRQAAAQGSAVPDCERKDNVRAYYWTVREFVEEGYLRFLFAEADDERSLLGDLVARVEHYLARNSEKAQHPACLKIEGEPINSFEELVEFIRARTEPDSHWMKGAGAAAGTAAAFVRRLEAARLQVGHLIWGASAEKPDEHRIEWQANQVSVIDIHNLSDRGKRFVTGVVIKRMFEDKERAGRRFPLSSSSTSSTSTPRATARVRSKTSFSISPSAAAVSGSSSSAPSKRHRRSSAGSSPTPPSASSVAWTPPRLSGPNTATCRPSRASVRQS